jgi:pantoate--beta-alanine ligase
LSDTVLVRTASHIRELVESWRRAHQTVALVPTMGNLHRGHASLVELAGGNADRVVMSIFVNPTQFGPGEDFAAYPRTLDEDRELVAETGLVDALFVPDAVEVYPFGVETAVRFVMPDLARELCGAKRPGHFDGVGNVVCRLLNIVSPDILVLGRKDYQQVVLLERMIADLRLPVQVISGETQRDDDGLAISSRNRYLTPAERKRAPALHTTLIHVRDALASGDRDFATLEAMAVLALKEAGFKPDYVEVRNARDLSKPNGRSGTAELIVLAAAWLGKARLIDNVRVSP